MKHIKEDTYNIAKRNRMKLYSRLRMGFHQLIYRPYNSIIILITAFLYLGLWRNRARFFPLGNVPKLLLPIYRPVFFIIAILIPIVFLLGFLNFLGDRASIHYEACLIMAFSPKELRNGHPILINCIKIKGTDVTVIEFYTQIPLHIWLNRKLEIADIMNVHFVQPEIEHGGKQNNNGNRIRIYTAPGTNRIDRGNLYDEEL